MNDIEKILNRFNKKDMEDLRSKGYSMLGARNHLRKQNFLKAIEKSESVDDLKSILKHIIVCEGLSF